MSAISKNKSPDTRSHTSVLIMNNFYVWLVLAGEGCLRESVGMPLLQAAGTSALSPASCLPACLSVRPSVTLSRLHRPANLRIYVCLGAEVSCAAFIRDSTLDRQSPIQLLPQPTWRNTRAHYRPIGEFAEAI